MKTQSSYFAYYGWLCIFAVIPGILVFCFTNELSNYKTLIPWIVVSVAIFPLTLAITLHKELSTTNDMDGLTQNEASRLKNITLKARKFVTACILVNFLIVCLIVTALVLIDTIKANFLYTAIASIGGMELYVLYTLLNLQSNIGDFKSSIKLRNREMEINKKQREALNKVNK